MLAENGNKRRFEFCEREKSDYRLTVFEYSSLKNDNSLVIRALLCVSSERFRNVAISIIMVACVLFAPLSKAGIMNA